MFFKSLPVIMSILLLISCESSVNESVYKSDILDSNEYKKINKINPTWVENTIELVKLGEVDKGRYVNYNAIINQETSLDETWKAVTILERLNLDYNKLKIINYVKQYKPENEIDKLKINSILKMTKQPLLFQNNYDEQIKKLIKRDDLSSEEKIDEVFLYHLYIGKESLQLSEPTVNLLKLFLTSVNFSKDINPGYYYDLVYLNNEYGLDKDSINKDYWQDELNRELKKKEINLVNLYYIYNINFLLENPINSELLNKIGQLKTKNGSYNISTQQKEGTILSTYLVVDILEKSGKTNLIEKDKLTNFILGQQEVKTGGFIVRKIVKPDLTSGILAETSLNLLGYKNRNLPPAEVIDFLVDPANQNWKVKFFGLRLVGKELSEEQQAAIRKNVKTFLNEASQLKEFELESNLQVLDEIVYAMYINKDLKGSVPKKAQTVLLGVSDDILENYKDKSPVEIALALEIKKIFEIDIKNRREIIQYILDFYDSNENQFIYKEHNEMMINYFFIKSLILLDYNFKGVSPKVIIFKFADLENGGFNTLRAQFETSSLLTTFYGITLLHEILNIEST